MLHWPGQPDDTPRTASLLRSTALFALLWSVARACLQSLTIDEAHTYLFFVRPDAPAQWQGAANNHLLNSLLMRLSVALFGANHLTLRLPALLGAAIFIFCALALATAIARRPLLRWTLFVCLVFNPFVMDYLVAARGYGLAAAFLMAAFLAIARWQRGIGSRVANCALASACLGLSFVANFSFGVADALAAALLCLWAAYQARHSNAAVWRTLAACALPGLAVTAFFAAPALVHWRRAELIFGATSLGETLASLVRSSFYELNADLLNPFLHPFLSRWHHLILPLLVAAAAWHGVAAYRAPRAPEAQPWRWSVRWLLYLAALTLAALAGHWALYRFWHVWLPKDRTALFFVPMATLAVGIVAALPVPSRLGQASRRAVAAMLLVTACYFLGCLRLRYFREWQFDADARAAYDVVAYYSHARGVTEVAANWRYVAVLDAYRLMSGREHLAAPRLEEHYPSGKPLYVLYFPDDRAFIDTEGLRVVYRNDASGVAVAIRPDVEAQ